jgi:lysozyme
MQVNRRAFLGSALAGLALLPAACAPSRQGRNFATPATVAEPRKFGLDAVVDLHHYEDVSDFTLVRRSGIAGLLHKASEGFDWFDPKYEQRRQEALRAGLLWGAYHFGTGEHSGAEQADSFFNAAKPGPETLLALDLELNERNPANSMNLGQAEEFVYTLRQRTGFWPLLYVHPAWADGEKRLGRSLGGAILPGSILSCCDLWLADYRNDPVLPTAWKDIGWRFWQYAGAGTRGPFVERTRQVPGISVCDRNLFAGSADELAAYWRGKKV